MDFGPVVGTAQDLLYLAAAIPVVLLAVRWIGRRPAGTVSSVAGRLRWRWLAVCLLAAVLCVGLMTASTLLLPADDGAGVGGTEAGWAGWQVFGPAMAMLLVLVPLQSAAEEYVFRGWLLQAVGGYLRSPWCAVLPQAVLFAAAHGLGTPWGFADLVFFAAVAGWLTIRTGGLEASICLHVINNLVSFGFSAAVVDGLASDETAADSPWQLVLIDCLAISAYAAAVLWLARRRRPARTAPAAVPAPVPMPVWVPAPVQVPAHVPGWERELTGDATDRSRHGRPDVRQQP